MQAVAASITILSRVVDTAKWTDASSRWAEGETVKRSPAKRRASHKEEEDALAMLFLGNGRARFSGGLLAAFG